MSKNVFLIFILLLYSGLCRSSTIQFETPTFVNENGEVVITQVMVSESEEHSLSGDLELLEDFLVAKSNGAIQPYFLYANFSQTSSSIGPVIDQEAILKELSGIGFSAIERVDIPDEWLDVFGNRKPDQENGLQLEDEFNRYYKSNYKVKKISLIAARTLVNGSVASAGFMAAHIPVSSAIILGSLTGIMSGSMQLISNHLIQYLSTNKYEVKFKKLLGFKGSKEVNKSKFLASQLKWFSLEVGFLTVLDITRFSLGLMNGVTLSSESMNLGMTAFKSLISQGAVDTSVAKDLEPKISNLIKEKNFVEAAKLRFRSELIAFSASMTWAGAAITDMMGLPLGNYLFAGMAAVGGGNHLRLALKDKTNQIATQFKQIFTCSKHFFKKE